METEMMRGLIDRWWVAHRAAHPIARHQRPFWSISVAGDGFLFFEEFGGEDRPTILRFTTDEMLDMIEKMEITKPMQDIIDRWQASHRAANGKDYLGSISTWYEFFIFEEVHTISNEDISEDRQNGPLSITMRFTQDEMLAMIEKMDARGSLR